MEPDEVVGVALVRVWIPVDAPDRVVIRLVAADAGGRHPIGVASTVSGATVLLQAWLESLTRDRGAGRGSTPDDGEAGGAPNGDPVTGRPQQ